MIKFDADAVSEKITNYLGSWKCIKHYALLILCWVVFNSVFAFIPVLKVLSVDVWPFQALNLILAVVAAMTGPLVMLSQKKADKARDELITKISNIEEVILSKVEQDIEIDENKLNKIG